MKLIDRFNFIELANKPVIQSLPSPTPKSKIKKWLKGFFFRLLFFILLIVAAILIHQSIYAGRIYPGVYLGSFQLGSLKREDAKFLLESAVTDIERNGLNFIGQSEKGRKEVRIKPVLIAVADPDLSRRIISFDLEATLDKAMAVGRQGTLVERLKQIFSSQLYGWPIEAVVQIDEAELKENIKVNFQSLEQEPYDASFELTKKEEIKLVKDEPGYFFNFDQAVRMARENLLAMNNEPINIQLIHIQPKIKIQDVKVMLPKIREILDSTPITLQFGEKKWLIEKSLLGQWLALKKNKEIELVFNQEKILTYLSTIAKDIDQEPLDAKFKMSGDRVIEFQPSRPGQKLQIESSAQEIAKKILAGNRQVDLLVKTIEPEILTQDINDLGIKELIGRGVSNFKGSPKNRRHNIAVGAKKLNGILIKPGEEFSLLKALGEVSEAAGYLPELVIKGSRTIPELGGGLCQIGTTTFRVALNAGLPITQRTPHAFRVIYYEPAGMDATIYQPQPDFRFINDTGYYILFQTRIEGDNLIFEFYGTSDGRKVEVSQPKIFNVVSPGPPVYIETTELPPGEKRKVEKAVAGADTEFTRIITWPDGRKKEEVWKSHYRPWQEVWLIGVEKTTETTPSSNQ